MCTHFSEVVLGPLCPGLALVSVAGRKVPSWEPESLEQPSALSGPHSSLRRVGSMLPLLGLGEWRQRLIIHKTFISTEQVLINSETFKMGWKLAVTS